MKKYYTFYLLLLYAVAVALLLLVNATIHGLSGLLISKQHAQHLENDIAHVPNAVT